MGAAGRITGGGSASEGDAVAQKAEVAMVSSLESVKVSVILNIWTGRGRGN